MSVLLTNPFDPGDLDPGHTYPRANIVSQEIRPEEHMVQIRYEFGDFVDTVWIKGAASPSPTVVVLGADYDTLITSRTTVEEDHKIYAGAKRVLYSYLIGAGILDGTVE